MKKDIHPQTRMNDVTCSTCGAKYSILSTSESISIDVCANCHSFYTGKRQQGKATGRIERFNKRFEKVASPKS